MTTLFSSSEQILSTVAWLAGAMVVLALVLAGFAFAERTLIRKRLRVLNELKGHWGDPVWRYLFGQAPASSVLSLVGDRDVLDFVAYLFPLVRRLDGEERHRLAELVHPFLGTVRSELRRRSPGRRAMAVEALGHFGEDQDLLSLLTALEDRSPLVAMVAARALTEWNGAWEHAHAILNSLDRFADWDAGFLATLVAGLGSGALPELRRKLTDPSAPPRIRRVAALALKNLNDPGSADPAVGVLATSVDRDLKATALRVLGQVGSNRHLASVKPYLVAKDYIMRVAAVDAFARLASREQLARLGHIVKHDPSQWVAIHAARGLRDAGEVRLLERLATSEHPRSAVAVQAIMEGG